MSKAAIFAALLALAAAGPAFADTTTAPPSNAPADLRKQADALNAKPISKFIWRMNDDGSASHLQSGLVCPAKIGAFTLGRPATFDMRGIDIGCDYQNALGTEVTLYLTQRTGQSLDDDLAKAQAEVQQFHPGYTLLPPSDEGALPDASWKRTLYDGSKGTLHSGIWVRDMGGWTAEFRATYAALSAGDAVFVMTSLAAQALSTAGSHLAACAAAAPVTRTGAPVKDKDTLMMMMIMAAGVVGAADDDKPDDKTKDTPAGPAAEDWCVEPAGIQGALFWRNIASDEHTGAVDRLTVDGDTDEQVLVVEGAPFIAILTNTGARANAPLTHTVTLTQGSHAFLLAIYDGRPSADEVLALARDVLTKNRQPLIDRDLKTKDIHIILPP